MRRALLIVGVLLVTAGLAATMSDVHGMAVDERDYRSERQALGDQTGARTTLGRVTLAQGQSVALSVCSSDAFAGEAWERASFALFHHDPDELVLRVPLDQPRLGTLRQGPGGGCVDLARSESLAGGGEFSVAIEAERGATVSSLGAPDTVVWTHVTALRQLSGDNMVGPMTAFLGVLVLLAAGLVRAPAPSAFDALLAEELEGDARDHHDAAAHPAATPVGNAEAAQSIAAPAAPDSGPRRAALRRLVLALPGLLVAFVVSALLPPGPLTPMFAALVLFVGQLLIVFGLVQSGARLGLRAPPRWPLLLLLAMPALGVALRLVLAPLSQLVPSTGVAPIEQLVSAPSGMLTMLAIGLVAPFAEELFFRGLVFGGVEELRGTRWAAVVTALLFALVHAPQAFGAWPAFVSIAVAGAAFSAIRALTGSTVASALAHLGYNGIIALPVVYALLRAG